MRLLIVSHGHPAFHPGGGELVAHSIYQALRRNGYEAFFVGFVYPELLAGHGAQTVFAPNQRDHNDLAIRSNAFDFFMGRHGDLQLTSAFARIIEKVNPDVVHFHHFLMVGLESFRIVKNLRPTCKIVLTLHEYWAICARDGQMVRADGALCYESSLYQCAACLPDHPPDQFFLREQWIKSFLAQVDCFICPSRFLLERYQMWGLPPEKLNVIVNGISSNITAHSSGFSSPPQGKRILPRRFGFFGQLTRTKGVDILLEATRRLRNENVDFQLGIHGTLALQEKSHREGLESAFADTADDVIYFGPYQPQDAVELMARYDWIVIPSTWWENAPLVVEEALAARRPIICSDIGGLKEKVTPGRDGLHFRAGDSYSLATTLRRASKDPDLWQTLQTTLRPPVPMTECVARHVEQYQSLLD
ncbi:MAG TPA: glycosyltransferase family 4 protein [Candidatus Competibacteraceae bacterium]|nr:glycosyltransferase family 4 protein [Candidatus Competibacteraceae bacterium]MCP5134352.1 glycosyltransferase family 4 protein [Gammaproteobacteria bacterium]HPF58899.1 glycosyltransferase family 4 protein [Candidatus Competibacteraceae bacterium]HRY18399.1 glycosyltransferase family 4 protein [Candidatus Competibacteraceae bacterium]